MSVGASGTAHQSSDHYRGEQAGQQASTVRKRRGERGAMAWRQIHEGEIGVPGRIRTRDPLLRRQPLYPLSYWDVSPYYQNFEANFLIVNMH